MEEKKSKQLNLFDLTSIGTGAIIGAGIFSMLGTGIALTGRSISLALVAGMFLVFMQQIRSLFTASMFALDGGMYAQQALVLPPLLVGVSAIILAVSGMSYSVFGISLASYLAQLFPALGPYQKIVGVVIVTIFFAGASQGAKFVAKIQNVMAMVKYLALALFIILGFSAALATNSAPPPNEPFFIDGAKGFLMATAIMSFTCNGGSVVLNFTGSTKNATKNVPLGFLMATLVATAIYFLLGFVASGVLPYSEVAGQNLGYIAGRILPAGLSIFFIVGAAMVSLTTALFGGIASTGVPILSSAKDGWFPEAFTRTTKKGYPYVIMGGIYLLSVGPIIGGFTLDAIVSFIMVPGMVLGFLCNIYGLKLPKQFPDAWAKCGMHCPYWVYVTAIVVSMLASLVTAVFSLLSLNMAGMIGNVVFTTFLFIYAWWRMKSGKVRLQSVESVQG